MLFRSSIHITDNTGVNLSTVRLYVQGFVVFYSAVPVPGGYNISYNHPINFTQGEIVRCRLYGEDAYGNILDYSWEFLIDTGARYFSIDLQAGWNLISIPFDTYNQSIQGVLSTIDGKYDMVRAYSATGPSNPWLVYSPDWATGLNDNFQITREIGVWVRATESCTLQISGIPSNSTNIPLYAGWNLVGYTIFDEKRSLATALWGTGADSAAGFDQANPYLITELGAGYIMKTGEGYWVHVPADTVWILQ